MYVIFTAFPLGQFAERRRLDHPEWKESRYCKRTNSLSQTIQSIEEKLRNKNPGWPEAYFPPKITDEWVSSKQWYNPNAWENLAQGQHDKELDRFLQHHPDMTIKQFLPTYGVNVTGLMYEIGIELQWRWPPIHDLSNTSYLVSLAGYPLSKK